MTVNEIIKQMLDDGEFEKLIKETKGKDKKAIQEFYGLVKDNEDLEKIPEFVLLNAIYSLSLFRDIILYKD